ncbi:MAG: hypothetical protein IBX55_02845 [Methyloprofundus sp.]|nr:hypothetical protein [Methyloprofundus sp.]
MSYTSTYGIKPSLSVSVTPKMTIVALFPVMWRCATADEKTRLGDW